MGRKSSNYRSGTWLKLLTGTYILTPIFEEESNHRHESITMDFMVHGGRCVLRNLLTTDLLKPAMTSSLSSRLVSRQESTRTKLSA